MALCLAMGMPRFPRKTSRCPQQNFKCKNIAMLSQCPLDQFTFKIRYLFNWRSYRRKNFTQYALASDLSNGVGRDPVKYLLCLVLAKYFFALMLSLWEMGASYSEAIFSKMPRQSCLKNIEHTTWLFV